MLDEESLVQPPGLTPQHAEPSLREQVEGACTPAVARADCTPVEGESLPMDQTEGSGLPAVTRADCASAEGEVDSSAFPTEERLREVERHKRRKEAGLEKFATKR